MLARISVFIVLGYAAIVIPLVLSIAISEAFVSAIRDFFRSDLGMPLSAAFCVILGMSFILAAPAVKFPLLFKIIGTISLIEVPLLLFVPLDLWIEYIDFWLVDNLAIYRIFSVPLGIGISVFLIVASLPGLKGTNSYISANET